jgi:hypothetical protein
MAKMPMFVTAAAVALAAVLATAVPGSAAVSAPAGPSSPVSTSKVGPNQAFIGLVNGDASNATIDVLCPGPLRVNQKGDAASGQTLAIESPSAVAVASGTTGSKADSIVAQLAPGATSTSAAVGVTVIFTKYGTEPFPTNVLLPCDGSSAVVFTPRPTSKTARSTRVDVRFEPTCATPVCPVVANRPERS